MLFYHVLIFLSHQNGGEILSQKLHTTPVERIRLQTYEPVRPGICGEQQEELLLLYSNVLVCIEGFSLFQTLRACRNHLARGKFSLSSGEQRTCKFKFSFQIDEKNLIFGAKLKVGQFWSECQDIGQIFSKWQPKFKKAANEKLFFTKCLT